MKINDGADQYNFISTYNNKYPMGKTEEAAENDNLAQFTVVGDKICISNEAKNYTADNEKNDVATRNGVQTYSRSQLLKMADDSDKQAKAAAEEFSIFTKCITISSRIMNGDNVPPKDKKFLLENEPEMYAKAVMMRRENDDPKDYKSVLDDEDEDTDDSEGGQDSTQTEGREISQE